MKKIGLKRGIAVFAVALAAWGGWAIAQMKPDTSQLAVQSIDVAAKPIAAFDPSNADKRRFGKLEWRGGLTLSSASPAFGGWSGLSVAPDGRSITAISDAGTWMTAKLTYAGSSPSGLSDARLGPIKARDGHILSKRRDRDAEAIVLEGANAQRGPFLIAFEQNDRIGRFDMAPDGLKPPSSYLEMPREAKAMRVDGFEALTLLAGGPNKGALVAFAERAKNAKDECRGWIWINGKPAPLSLAGMKGFNVTDVASLDDGTLLVLERRFRWTEGVKMRLRRVKADAVQPGATLDAETLLDADMSQEIDNMEGIGVSKGANGEPVLTLISDDNFNRFLQRTVLLQFALVD